MNHILVLNKADLLHLWNNWAADGYLMILENYLSLVIVDIFSVSVDVFFNCGKTQNINVHDSTVRRPYYIYIFKRSWK